MNTFYGEPTSDIDETDGDRLSDAEVQLLMSGRASIDDVSARRKAAHQKAAQQMELLANPNLAAALDRLEQVEAHYESLQRRVGRLEHLLAATPTLEEGKLPAKADITRLWCQVFHTPNLSAKERKTKTEWSLRLTVWIDGRRVKRELNVRLFSADRFYRQVAERNPLPKVADEWATALQDDETVLAGMLTATTQGRGRPFIGSQFCVLSGQLDGTPRVDLVIDSDAITFENVRPSKGTSTGTSKWFLDWHA